MRRVSIDVALLVMSGLAGAMGCSPKSKESKANRAAEAAKTAMAEAPEEGMGSRTTAESAPARATKNSTPSTVSFRLKKDRFEYELAFKLPAGWKRDPVWKEQQVFRMDDGAEFDYPTFSFYTTCGGSCAPEALAKAEAGAISRQKEVMARPNINSGDPARDAIRAQLEVIEEGTLPLGHFAAVRVKYDPKVLASGPYRQIVKVVCTYYRPGFPSYVGFIGSAPLNQEGKVLAPLLEVCRGLGVNPVAK